MHITVRYGASVLNNIEVDEGSSVAELITKVGPILGLPESVDVFLDGDITSSDSLIEYGVEEVSFEKKACNKA